MFTSAKLYQSCYFSKFFSNFFCKKLRKVAFLTFERKKATLSQGWQSIME